MIVRRAEVQKLLKKVRYSTLGSYRYRLEPAFLRANRSSRSLSPPWVPPTSPILQRDQTPVIRMELVEAFSSQMTQCLVDILGRPWLLMFSSYCN